MSQQYEDLVELGKFYILSQRFDEAIKILKRARRLNNRDPQLYYDLGIAHEALNEKDDAIKAFRLALSLDPSLKAAAEHLERLIKE